jgi:membrane protease YdiL (CAAX protease family)
VFINREGELRSGWRAAAFVVCLYVLTLLLGGIVYLVGVFLPSVRGLIQPAITGAPPDRALVRFALDSAVSLCSAIIATYICATRLEHRTLGSVGFKPHQGWRGLFVAGSLLGAGTLGLAIAAEATIGSATFSRQHHDPAQVLSSFIGILLVFLMAAGFEELVFRGFAFQALVHNMGPAVAILIMSVFFGLAHLGNPNPTLISTANTILAGIWLSVAYLATRSLWFATALHYSWNFVMVYVFGLPVSGISTFDTLGLLAGQDRCPVLVSGGDYGPEGGIAATVVLILSTLLIWKSGWFKVSDDMAQAIKHGRPEPPYISIAPSVTDGSQSES